MISNSKFDKQILHIPLKGNRTYIQGGSFFDEVNNYIQKEFDSSSFLKLLSIHKLTARKCYVTFGEEAVKKVASFKISGGNGDINGLIVESEELITERIDSKESALLSDIDFSRKIIHQKQLELALTPIETIVELTKRLHNESIPLNIGKWMFVQINLNEAMQEKALYKVIIKQNIKNKFTVSEVIENGKVIGKIQFAVGDV